MIVLIRTIIITFYRLLSFIITIYESTNLCERLSVVRVTGTSEPQSDKYYASSKPGTLTSC